MRRWMLRRATLALAGLLAPAGCVMSGADNLNDNFTDNAGGGGNENTNDNNDPAVDEALTIDPEVDHVLGDLSAPNKIIEYGNYFCSHCADFHVDNFPDIEALVDEGTVVYVFRHIAPTSDATVASMAAECAALQDPEAFYPFHDLIFESEGTIDGNRLLGFAEELELDPGQLSNCISAGTTLERVQRDAASATTAGVTATPTFFINGQILVGNAAIDDFEEFFE